MQGLSFIHFGFLAAGLAVAVPIVIHLLFRQRTRTLAIGSVRFLQQVVREHRRRRRVRQWLLLALRMLAVLLLALLFARPYRDESFRRGLQQELVVLVDRSASMSARNARGESAFERGLALARDELKRLDENVIVHLALFDSAGVRELSLEELAKAATTEAATDYGLALGWAGDVLAASNRSDRRIVLITDLQRSGISRRTLAPLPAGIELGIRDAGEALARNVAVESAEPVRTEIRPDSTVAVRALVRNHAPLAARQLVVRCRLDGPDGTVEASGKLDVGGGAGAVLDLPLEIKTDGLYRGEITVEADDVLPLDDRRWLAFEARHPDRLLLVDGQEGRSVFANETYFLETALRLRTDEAGGLRRSFEPERIAWEAGEGFPRLDGYRAVVLANVRALAEEDGRRLDEYLRGGGSLLVFAGDQTTGKSLEPLAKRGLFPGKLADAPVEGRFRIDEWDAKHPALTCFADPQQGDLRRVELRQILPLASPVEGATVLLASRGQVVAAETTVGAGRCLYFGSTADRDWTDLPRTRMYVPLVRQLLAWLTDQLGDRGLVANRLVTRPDEKSGITKADPAEAGSLGERWIVTNLDPRESALERVTTDELHEIAGTGPSKLDDEARQAALALAIPPDALRPDEFWTSFVWLLLIVLAAETLLASRVHA